MHFIRLEHGILPVLLFVPVWGSLSAALLKCRPEPSRCWTVADTLYDHEKTFRALPQDTEERAAELVPLEEALLLDSAAQRRRLVLLLLADDPAQNYELLELARKNTDCEVVHYAAAAMMQAAKLADLTLQRLQEECHSAPQDTRVRNAYRKQLQQALDTGVVQGYAAQFWRQQLAALLERQLPNAPDNTCGCQLAETQLALQDYGAADQTLAALIAQWPGREAPWLLRLRCAAARGDGAAVHTALDDIRKLQVYLSAAGRETIRFWQEGMEHETVS